MLKVYATLIILLGAISSRAQETVENIISQLDQKNAAIVAKADTLSLMKLLAPSFTINRTTGTIVSGRERIFELMRKGMVSYDSFSVITEGVLIKDSTTVVSMGSEVVISGGDRERKGETVRRRFTHVWVKSNNEWQLLARHASNVCND